MAFRTWQIGLHLQPREAVAVAVIRGASGWLLQRWWRLPLAQNILQDGHIREPEQLAQTLLPWSRELPRRHHIRLSFPANRTLQKAIPRPAMALREREQTAWLAGSIARELDMDPDSLHFDYCEDTSSPEYHVTAAQSKELAALLQLAQTLRVHVSAITPDACALQRFIPYLPPPQQCLAWRDEDQWLWAMRYTWGRKRASEIATVEELAHSLSLPPETVALCGAGGFEPWKTVTIRQPPLPPAGADFAIALGLALGEWL